MERCAALKLPPPFSSSASGGEAVKKINNTSSPLMGEGRVRVKS